MGFKLKSITNSSQIKCATNVGIHNFVFDLRPKSFNFIQLHKIESICQENFLTKIGLLFANEKDFVVHELQNKLKAKSIETQVEFIDVSDIAYLDSLGVDYALYWNSSLRLKDIESAKNLKRLIFEHKALEVFQQKGELFGFLSLFKSLEGEIDFELKLEWSSSIIESMMSYFDFQDISLELDSSVEVSFQQIDENAVTSIIKHFKSLFK